MAREDPYKDRSWFPYANLITPIYEMDISEEDRIMVAFYQSTKEFHGYMNDGKKPAKPKNKRPHSGYVCHICGKPGHYIDDCWHKDTTPKPQPVKRNHGIPKTHLIAVNKGLPGARKDVDTEDTYSMPKINAMVYAGMDVQPKVPAITEPADRKVTPKELLCPLCSDMIDDAVTVACCCFTYCSKCIMAHVPGECPNCNTSLLYNNIVQNKRANQALRKYKRGTHWSQQSHSNQQQQ